jgi:hypothetical protein
MVEYSGTMISKTMLGSRASETRLLWSGWTRARGQKYTVFLCFFIVKIYKRKKLPNFSEMYILRALFFLTGCVLFSITLAKYQI